MGERDIEVELKEKDEIIMSLRLNEHLLNDKLEISRRNMSKQLERINALEKENEQLKEQVQILNKCCRLKLSDEMIKQAYADLNRREREKHSQGNATYVATMNQNEVMY